MSDYAKPGKKGSHDEPKMNVVQKEERPWAREKGSSSSFDCEVSKLNFKGQSQSKSGALLRGTEWKFEKPRKGQSKRLCCEVPKEI